VRGGWGGAGRGGWGVHMSTMSRESGRNVVRTTLRKCFVALVLARRGEGVAVERRATARHVCGQPPPLQRGQRVFGLANPNPNPNPNPSPNPNPYPSPSPNPNPNPNLQRGQQVAGGDVHSVVGVAEGEVVDAVGEVGGLDVEALLLAVDAQQQQPRHALHHHLARRRRVPGVGCGVG